MEKASDQVYLLRCWQKYGEWRFSVETIGPQRHRRGFSSLEDLVAFLRGQLSPPEQGPSTPSPPG